MNRRFALVAAVALAASSAPAFAQDGDAGAAVDWSVLTGRTVGAGAFVIHPEFGWPGLGAAFIYGAGSAFDVGGRFTFNYGSEFHPFINPEIKMQGFLKFKLVERSKFSLALRTEPGLGFLFPGPFAIMAIFFPVYMDFGIHPIPQLGIVMGMDLPFQILFALAQGGGVQFGLPMAFGPGIEFALTPNVQLTFNTRFGPGIAAPGGVGFAFKTMMGVAVKF